MISLIEEFVMKKEFEFLKVSEIPLAEIGDAEKLGDYEYPIDYLLECHPDRAETVIRKQILLGIIMDCCYFIQESLGAAQRRRMVVAYSLLRRPLVDNLVILMRLLADADFYTRFCSDNNYDPCKTNDIEVKELLKASASVSAVGIIPPESIFEFVFDKDNPNSFINLANRAIHPTTTRKWNKTGEMNFNFIFSCAEDIDAQLEIYYGQLLPCLLFYFDILLSAVLPFAPEEKVMELRLIQIAKAIVYVSGEDALNQIIDGYDKD